MIDILNYLGLGFQAASAIRNKIKKKVTVSPKELDIKFDNVSEGSTAHSNIAINNISEKPIFQVEVLCWAENSIDGIAFEYPQSTSLLEFYPGMSADTNAQFIYCEYKGKKFIMIHVDFMEAKSTFKLEVIASKPNVLILEPLRYTDKSPGISYSQGSKEIVFPSFTAPFVGAKVLGFGFITRKPKL